jgi:hypothetical protein
MNLGNEVVGPCDDRRTGLDLLAGRAGLSIRPTAQRRSAAAMTVFGRFLRLFPSGGGFFAFVEVS